MGFAGCTFQSTVEPFNGADEPVPFTSATAGVTLNNGLPAQLGRSLPFAAVSMSTGSALGPLTAFRDPSRLRIAGQNDNPSGVRRGVSSSQLPPNVSTTFDTSLSPVVFKYAIRINDPLSLGFATISTPLDLISNARANWFTSANGQTVQTTLEVADIRSAQIYVGGNPCLTPQVIVAPTALHLHPSYLYHSTQSASRYALTLSAFGINSAPICGPIWTWRHDGVLLMPGGAFIGVNSDLLAKANLTWADRGTYQVSLNTGGGTTTASATVDANLCITDFDDGSGMGHPDGGIGIEDLLYYLDLYGAGTVFADIDDGSGTGTFDNGVGIEDLLYFLDGYQRGC
jgi:hypothetical protein